MMSGCGYLSGDGDTDVSDGLFLPPLLHASVPAQAEPLDEVDRVVSVESLEFWSSSSGLVRIELPFHLFMVVVGPDNGVLQFEDDAIDPTENLTGKQ